VELAEHRLFVELAMARGGWLWCNDKIGNSIEDVLGYCLGVFVKRAKDKMVNIIGGEVPTAWCG
jgi:hypothetical protein